MSKLNSSHGFISLLYSISDNPLHLWSKYISSDGRVRRVEDENLNGDRVIEISESENSPIRTNISCPASAEDCLNIQLPVLVIILKNLKSKIQIVFQSYFYKKFKSAIQMHIQLPVLAAIFKSSEKRVQITFQLIDEENIRRKFIISTFETNGKGTIVEADTARLTLKLEDDWNSLEIDLRNLCQSIYCTEYKALQRLIIYPNCRIRRIHLQDRHYEQNETPIQLCQAFFDMYMLKWGINFVEKSCQTNVTHADIKNDKSISSTETILPRTQRDAKSVSVGKLSSLKLSSQSPGEKPRVLRDDLSSIDTNKDEKKTKISRAETAKGKKVSGADREAPNIGKTASTPIYETTKNKDENEGEIFRKWPYNYLKLQQGQSVTTKLKSIDPTKISTRTTTIVGAKVPNIVESLNNFFPRGKVMSPIEIPIPPEVETEAAAETAKIVQSTRSKLLTTDEAVCDFLELRHVLNRKMLENFQPRGLTMTEVELSIYNSKNRRNSFGQGKLVEKHRTRVDKACNVVSQQATRKKRQKSAFN